MTIREGIYALRAAVPQRSVAIDIDCWSFGHHPDDEPQVRVQVYVQDRGFVVRDAVSVSAAVHDAIGRLTNPAGDDVDLDGQLAATSA